MIELKRIDEFAVLTLSRPEVMNALSFSLLDALERRLDEVEPSDARVLIVTGAGKAFSAGADVSELAGRTAVDELARTRRGQQIVGRLETLKQPSIALVDGYALGGGCELSLCCTFRLATSRASFGLPEVKLGLVPGYGGTQRLPRIVGEALALDVMMSGRFISAEEALRAGLVSRIVEVDKALDEAIAFGRSFSAHSLSTIGFIRDAVRLGMQVPLHEALEIEAQLSTLSYRTDDGQEGLKAFVEKRQRPVKDR